MPARTDFARGELMFRGQCMACHTLDGYRPMRKFLQGRDRKGVANIVDLLHGNRDDSPYRSFMPPVVGTTNEIESLTDYLASLVPTNSP
jgi:mono/diheme cytochrome c family protein